MTRKRLNLGPKSVHNVPWVNLLVPTRLIPGAVKPLGSLVSASRIAIEDPGTETLLNSIFMMSGLLGRSPQVSQLKRRITAAYSRLLLEEQT
jgi:hypothetical protein